MAALSVADRLLCYSDFIREIGAEREAFNGVTKANVMAAASAVTED